MNLEDNENKNIINKCIEDIEILKTKKDISDTIFNNIQEKIKENNNDILPLIDNKSFKILSELIGAIVFDCYVNKSYCNYNKKNIYDNITLKIIKMKCDDFKHINKAIRNISNELTMYLKSLGVCGSTLWTGN